VQTRTLACFIGTLVATKPAVPLAPLYFRALQDLKDRALHQYQSSYQSWVQLSQEAKTDLYWWKIQLLSHLSTSLLKPEASIVIETDASKQGWGGVCQGMRTGGRWTAAESQHHINYSVSRAEGSIFSTSVICEGQEQCLYSDANGKSDSQSHM